MQLQVNDSNSLSVGLTQVMSIFPASRHPRKATSTSTLGLNSCSLELSIVHPQEVS